MQRGLKPYLLAVGVLLILVAGLISQLGVKVEVVNVRSTVMRNVSVDVTGASYFVGDISPGANRVVKVKPRGESAVSIRYLDNTGSQHTLFVDTYFERGYYGKIIVQVKNGNVTNIKDNVIPFTIV